MQPIRRVVCGISGGVDSGVAALLLKQKGYEVVGAFMRNWDVTNEVGVCMADKEMEDATRVTKTLGIPLKEMNFVKDYWQEVFSEFLSDYENGLTPNPDILCNRHIKFNTFVEHALTTLDADAVATGHYARTSFGSYLEDYQEEANVKLLTAADEVKDQTFFLSQVRQRALRRAMFPLSDLTKDQVKRIASEAGMDFLVKKKESMGICFIGSRDFKKFIRQYLDAKPGNFVDCDTGEVVGRHAGIHNYTLGQRCRLGGKPHKYYVARKHVKTREVEVAAGTHHPALYSNSMTTGPAYWIDEQPPARLRAGGRLDCLFRFQHGKPLVPCTVTRASDDGLDISLSVPQRALTPGQYATLYDGRECLGSARIQHVGPTLHEVTLNRSSSDESRAALLLCQS
ncbi:PREDICTED: mitochondrial tRNA-specific 2-thiouridylase 1-like [Priapulus caudatus]|uniref:tRNA-5-taurinomethyluridine 2-sulfurtransferase n=1 Tax=Priapulus caudatus TaxID=37621 RepID=A0ABM1EF93_PRICU|nr:PREDICTED: mitochondrial tRNA-specific 2-thiouridylase 1-like [Priapulus caudatus]